MRIYVGQRGDFYDTRNEPGVPCPTPITGMRPYPTRRMSFTPVASNAGVRYDLSPEVVAMSNRLMPGFGPHYIKPQYVRHLPQAGVNNIVMRGFRDDGIPIPGLGF